MAAALTAEVWQLPWPVTHFYYSINSSTPTERRWMLTVCLPRRRGRTMAPISVRSAPETHTTNSALHLLEFSSRSRGWVTNHRCAWPYCRSPTLKVRPESKTNQTNQWKFLCWSEEKVQVCGSKSARVSRKHGEVQPVHPLYMLRVIHLHGQPFLDHLKLF